MIRKRCYVNTLAIEGIYIIRGTRVCSKITNRYNRFPHLNIPNSLFHLFMCKVTPLYL